MIGIKEHSERVYGLERGDNLRLFFGSLQKSDEVMRKKEIKEIVDQMVYERIQEVLKKEREKLIQEVRKRVTMEKCEKVHQEE